MNELKCWFVGVDWASENHRVRIADGCGKRLGERDFAHGSAGFRDRFSPAGAKDDGRDAEVLSDALRTDRRAFRRLALAEPLVIELRAWSRITDDLNGERNRLCNRLREQLWRYFPAMLELEQDLGAEWFLDLWELVLTPDKVMRIREASIARILKSRRIRRLTAAEALPVLRKPPVTVAPGTIEAGSAHIRVLTERLRLVNRQLKDAHRQLDRLCGLLAEPRESEPGQVNEQRDAAILTSLPGNGRIVLATLLAEGWEALQRRDYHALRTLCGAAPVTKRSGKSCIVTRRRGCRMLSTTGHALPCSTILAAALSTPLRAPRSRPRTCPPLGRRSAA
jgi:transposase